MRLKHVLWFAIIALFAACKEIIATDISNQTPELIVPVLNDTVQNNPVLFKWEEMKGATKYRLQIVSPSFSGMSDYLLDTVISTTQFQFALDSSEYELKLTAMNGGYSSQTLGPIKFWVGVQPSSSSTNVTLTSPGNQVFVNAAFSGPFTWQSLLNATSYEFSLRKGSDFATGNIEHTQNSIATTQYTLPGSVSLTEGTYYWGVKGYFSAGETIFSTRSFLVDLTAPNTPALISPAASTFLIAGPISFTWSNGTDGGVVHAPVHSVIEISEDAGFVTLIESQDLIGNSTTINLTAGTYYWRVYNYDEAGNVSNYSSVIQFFVS
jgi:hypothetical protein